MAFDLIPKSPLKSGLISGSIAAFAGILANLPLHSPNDAYFNSATVMGGSLVVGIGAAYLWHKLAGRARRVAIFSALIALGFALVALAAIAGDSQMERSIAYIVPLAAIAFALTGGLTILLSRISLTLTWRMTTTIAFLAIALGAGLAGLGDEKSGELTLPSSQVTQEQREIGTYEEITFLVSDGSEATFTVGEQLTSLPLPSEAVMRSTALSGEVRFDRGASVIHLDLQRLTSDQSFRDRYVRRMFIVNRTATFTVSDIGPLPAGFAIGDEVTTQVTGNITILNVTVPLIMDIKARDDGDTIVVLGRTSFTWEQLDIPRPTAVRSVVSVEDEVSVEILLILRPRTSQ